MRGQPQLWFPTVRNSVVVAFRQPSQNLSSRFLKRDYSGSRTLRFNSVDTQPLQKWTHSLASSSTGNDTKPKIWDLYASVCLERKPIITKELNPMELKYSTFLEEHELEMSKQSDHEVRHQRDLKLLEKIKKGAKDKATTQMAQDFEDACTKELLKFVPLKVGRTTEADKVQDTKSLQRALDSHLVLVVEQKLGKDYKWVCPQLKRLEGETMRQTAERVLKETSPDIKARILGNAPWGYYSYKYPKGIQNQNGESVDGAKVFFFKANILSGNLSPTKTEAIEVKDFHWLTRSELEEKLTEEYHSKLSQFLVDED